MKTLLILLMVGMTNQAFAFEKEDSFSALRQAVMKSNKDYNNYKKKELEADNDRVLDWGKREVAAVQIEAGIEQEARDFKVDQD